MLEISYELALGIFTFTILAFGGFTGWLINTQSKLNSIVSKNDVILATLNVEIKYLVEAKEKSEKKLTDHDRRIQRLEDSQPSIKASK